MTTEVVEKRIIHGDPVIQVYARGTIHFNKAAHDRMRGWHAVLVTFDTETRVVRLTRDVSLPSEKRAHARKITGSGSTSCITAKTLLVEYGVVEQHGVKCLDAGVDFMEFGPLKVGDDDAV